MHYCLKTFTQNGGLASQLDCTIAEVGTELSPEREKYILLHLGSSVHFYCVGRRLEAMRKRAQRQMEQSDGGYVSCAIYHADIHTRTVSEPSAISI
jgi:hypothetical protein